MSYYIIKFNEKQLFFFEAPLIVHLHNQKGGKLCIV